MAVLARSIFRYLKDYQKATVATKFIGVGTADSSTDIYRRAFSEIGLANTSDYTSSDIVFISINGRRNGRVVVGTIASQIKCAMTARATLICDNERVRRVPYNIGERELAEFLTENNYMQVEDGEFYSTWRPND